LQNQGWRADPVVQSIKFYHCLQGYIDRLRAPSARPAATAFWTMQAAAQNGTNLDFERLPPEVPGICGVCGVCVMQL